MLIAFDVVPFYSRHVSEIHMKLATGFWVPVIFLHMYPQSE